jgi:hypothetical protein
MKVDLNERIKGLDGQDAEKENNDYTLSRQLSFLLASGNPDGIEPVKAFDWATELYKNGLIEVDRTDMDKLVSAVTNSKTMSNLLKGQLIVKLKSAKEIVEA